MPRRFGDGSIGAGDGGLGLLAKPLRYPAGERLIDLDAYSSHMGFGLGFQLREPSG